MRFRQFYSKLYFRISLDLVRWPNTGITGGAVSAAPQFFLHLTEEQRAQKDRAKNRWDTVDKQLKEHYNITMHDITSTGEYNAVSQPTRLQWLIEMKANRVPEYPDQFDPRFNLTGVKAIKRCVEEALVNAGNSPFTLKELIELEVVDVKAILIP